MAPTVVTNLGKIKGKKTKTRGNKSIVSFKAIPYAKPPIGDLRFALPEPVEPWSGTLDGSSRESPPCLQVNVLNPDSKYLIGQEDCLYLNVYTPLIPGAGKSSLFPVIVYLHGGAFCVGSNDSRLYGPDFLLDHSVVLVTVNYRLGPLGFLSFECDQAPGNQGCHDQLMALKWVRDYISSFGGDNSNVTLMGESAGGMSAFLHLVSPLSQGLFHKIIAMSASASTPFLRSHRKASIYAKKFAQHFGCSENDSTEEALRIMRSVPAKAIVEKSGYFRDWDAACPLPWKPIIDDHASRPFLPISFEQIIKSGQFAKDMPILAGFNSHEGLIQSAPFHKSNKKWEVLFKQWETWAPLVFFGQDRDLASSEDRQSLNKLREAFFGNKAYPDYCEDNLDTLEKMFSAITFQAPLVNDLALLAEAGNQIFQYNFSYQGTMTMADIFRLSLFKLVLNFSGRHFGAKLYQKKLGVCHGDDLFYLFPFAMNGFPTALKSGSDKLTSVLMVEMWTNFAKFGHPTPENSTTGLIWAPIREKKGVLHIGSGLHMAELDMSVQHYIDCVNRYDLKHNLTTLSSETITRIFSTTADKRNLEAPLKVQ